MVEVSAKNVCGKNLFNDLDWTEHRTNIFLIFGMKLSPTEELILMVKLCNGIVAHFRIKFCI